MASAPTKIPPRSVRKGYAPWSWRPSAALRSRPCAAYRLSFAVVVGLALGGCGSSASQTVTVTRAPGNNVAQPVPTRAEFIAKADAICARLKADQAPLEARAQGSAGEIPSSATEASIFREDIRLGRAATARFAALPRPPGDRGVIEKLLTLDGDEATDLGNVADAVEAEDSASFRTAIGTLKKVEAHDYGLAQGLGLKVCGRR
jgi:hypothetical protein